MLVELSSKKSFTTSGQELLAIAVGFKRWNQLLIVGTLFAFRSQKKFNYHERTHAFSSFAKFDTNALATLKISTLVERTFLKVTFYHVRPY